MTNEELLAGLDELLADERFGLWCGTGTYANRDIDGLFKFQLVTNGITLSFKAPFAEWRGALESAIGKVRALERDGYLGPKEKEAPDA